MTDSSPKRRRLWATITGVAAATAFTMDSGTTQAASTLGASVVESGRYFGAAVVPGQSAENGTQLQIYGCWSGGTSSGRTPTPAS